MKRWKLLTALFLLLAVCALALGIAAVRRAQRLPSRAGVRVPVLMYHAVGDDCWGEESLFVKPEELEKRLAQALRKKQPVFVFHWRGGGLNRQILSELLALAGTLAQARGKQASCSVNVPQAVIQLQFSDAPEPDITIQQANEGEAAPETQTVSE